MQPVYMIAGVSGVGKSWICRQLKHKFEYVPHDVCWSHPDAVPDLEAIDPQWGPKGSKSIHAEILIDVATKSKRPLITEVPFAERPLKETLESNGLSVVPVFVIEDPHTIAERYYQRERKELPKSAFSRASSILERAKEWGAFYGSSDQVLEHLKEVET